MTSISDTEVVNAPGGLVEVAKVTRTTSYSINSNTVAGAANIFSSNATFVADGSDYLIEFIAHEVNSAANAGAYVYVDLVDGAGNSIGPFGAVAYGDGTRPAYGQIVGKHIVTPTAGSVVSYNARGYYYLAAGNMVASAAGGGRFPIILRVSKILQASQLLVTQSNAPIVTSLPSGNLVTGQEVYLYTTYGYVRYLWDGSSWVITADNRKVYFQAHTSSVLGTTGGATMAFNRTVVNQGNCFNTGSYLFTAPFAADYRFRVQAQKRFTGNMQMFWILNGSTSGLRGAYTDLGGDSPGINMESILSLNAGNTVGVYYTLTAGDIYGGPTEYFTAFTGELIK